MRSTVLALSDCIHLLRGKVVEAPVSLIDGDAERLPMAAVVVFGELRDCDTLFVMLDRVPETVLILATAMITYPLGPYAVSPMTSGAGERCGGMLSLARPLRRVKLLPRLPRTCTKLANLMQYQKGVEKFTLSLQYSCVYL